MGSPVIRRVPPGWEHPRFTEGNYRGHRDNIGHYMPMFDKTFREAADEWEALYDLWRAGARKGDERLEWGYRTPYRDDAYFWEDGNWPPEPDYYRPEFTEEPTWYQVYEDISEGTPITPPFATKEEIVEYLVEHGDFRRDYYLERWPHEKPFYDKWDREAAEHLVERGSARPSMTVNLTPSNLEISVPEKSEPDVFPRSA